MLGILARFGTAAPDAIPEVLSVLHDPEASVRRRAARALSQLGPLPAETALRLRERLRDSDVDVRIESINALGTMGSEAKWTVPDLIGALSSSDSRVRAAAARALGRTGPQSDAQLSELLEILQAVLDRDGSRSVMRAAARAIVALRARGKAPPEESR